MCVVVVGTGDRGDVTPVPGATPVLRDAWRASVAALLRHAALMPPLALVHRLHTVLKVPTTLTNLHCRPRYTNFGIIIMTLEFSFQKIRPEIKTLTYLSIHILILKVPLIIVTKR